MASITHDKTGNCVDGPMGRGFGLEKLGLLAIRAPVVALAMIIVLGVAAGFSASRLHVDDSLTELFRADTPEFRQFENMSARFPSSEYDVLVVVEGDKLMTPRGLEDLRSLVLELNFVKSMSGLISLFSAREPPGKAEVPPPLVPAEIEEGPAFEDLKQRIHANRIVGGKLISKDGRLALIVLALDRENVQKTGLKRAIVDIRTIVDEQLKGTGLTAKLSGAPVMQLEIRNAVQRDRFIYNGIGFGLGALVCWIFYRRFSFMLIAAAAPAMAVLWSFGLLGLLDFRLNLFLNVITPLIMVISFSDSMHVVYVIRRQIMAGDDRFQAARQAVREVGPACVLTSFATALALLSLVFSQSALIRTFGIAASLSALVAFLSVITLVPTLSVLLLRKQKISKAAPAPRDGAMRFLGSRADALVNLIAAHPALYSLIGVLLTAAMGYAYFNVEPRYRLADQVPDKEQAIAASNRLDEKLTGANPIHVLIEWRKGRQLYTKETLDVVGKAHDIVERQAGLGNVWSVEMLRRWMAEGGERSTAKLKSYMDLLPRHLTRRFVTENNDATVITGRIPDIDASEILPLIDNMNKQFDKLRADHPGFSFSVTGLPAIAARNSANMINQLKISLLSTIAVVVLLMAVWFRAPLMALASIVPNLFPIFAAATVLYLSGIGLQFAGVIAFTVAFGLAVNDNIHYLYRIRHEQEQTVNGGGQNPVVSAGSHIGPVLVLTTLVLVFGLAITVFSGLPSLRLFGWLSGVILIAALVGVLVFLPAQILLFRKARSKRNR